MVGDDISMADYFLLPTLFAFGLAPEGKQSLPKFPGVVAWDNRMDALPTVVAFNAKLPPRTPIQHAREWVSPMTTLYVAEGLLTQYATNSHIHSLVDNVEFIIIPIVTVDQLPVKTVTIQGWALAYLDSYACVGDCASGNRTAASWKCARAASRSPSNSSSRPRNSSAK